jgi:hypothetical protein
MLSAVHSRRTPQPPPTPAEIDSKELACTEG